jgi:hypothetical protein
VKTGQAKTGRGAQRSDDLRSLVERALVPGSKAELLRRLEVGSGLPGPRMNLALALEFAEACVQIGPKADALALELAKLPPDEARGASTKEFLSVCGVLAVCARGTVAKENATRDLALAVLEERADDPRFRVRDAVPIGLAHLGSRMGDALLDRVEHWMDRYFHAAAVLLALSQPIWLETISVEDYYAPINYLHDAFVLAHEAPRSAVRYPGHKALVAALKTAPMAFARRFGVPVFDRLMIWAEHVKVPEMREVILANLEDSQLKRPFREEIKSIRAAVEASKKPPRDPTRLIEGMRSRGKKRGRR